MSPPYGQGVTGLIYAAIVAAWAAYLVPLALRRHDEAVRTRSVDRFSAAMRVLARPSATEADPVRALLSPEASVAASRPRPRISRAAAQRAAARRRRVLTALLVLSLCVAAVAAFRLLPWWAVFPPLAVCLGFLAACRRQVRADAEAYWADAVARLPSPSRRGARVAATYGTGMGDEPNDEPTVILRRNSTESQPAEAAAAELPQQVVAVAVPTADGGSLWDPLPVTLPTYVSKPAAPRIIRTVDLESPDEPAGQEQNAAAAGAGMEPEQREAVGS